MRRIIVGTVLLTPTIIPTAGRVLESNTGRDRTTTCYPLVVQSPLNVPSSGEDRAAWARGSTYGSPWMFTDVRPGWCQTSVEHATCPVEMMNV